MFRKKPQLTREQSLSAIPVRNQAVEVTRDETGLVSISIPRKKAWWVDLLAKVFFVPEQKRVGLDEIGSYVWDRCDGKNNVRAIVGEFQKKFKLNRKEAELSMLNYLKLLAKKRLIGLVIREPQESKKKGKKKKR
ncbi:MAG: PqqD family protein [Planctomycetes bacterium]|nr:PqqD family protein [Planctomycetota bacterium]